jgi:hypothetical protein
VFSSNFNQDTNYLEWSTLWFSPAPPGKCQENTLIRPWLLPCTPFPIHQLSSICHLTLYSMRYWQYSKINLKERKTVPDVHFPVNPAACLLHIYNNIQWRFYFIMGMIKKGDCLENVGALMAHNPNGLHSQLHFTFLLWSVMWCCVVWQKFTHISEAEHSSKMLVSLNHIIWSQIPEDSTFSSSQCLLHESRVFWILQFRKNTNGFLVGVVPTKESRRADIIKTIQNK